MFLAILLGLFHFTHPLPSKPVGDCSPSDTTTSVQDLFDLARTEVWGFPSWSETANLLLTWNSGGMEGLSDSFFLPDYWMGTIYVVEVDSTGNSSCHSNYLSVGIPTTSVPPVGAPIPTVYYDLQGRRVQKPSQPGIYFARTGTRVRRIVKLR